MTAKSDTFERPDLFERDTWNKQVFDVECVVQAIASGGLKGTGLPYVLLGHSRGGVTAIFFAARQAAELRLPQPAGVITAGSPDHACGLSEREKHTVRDTGYLESPSSRTGQNLRIGLTWLAEQEADPDAHDVLGSLRKIEIPILVVHGENDATINVDSAAAIAGAAANARVVRITNCNHVFNTPNPPPHDFFDIPELARAVDEIVKFSRDCCVAKA